MTGNVVIVVVVDVVILINHHDRANAFGLTLLHLCPRLGVSPSKNPSHVLQ
jgi:hypothetical protein